MPSHTRDAIKKIALQLSPFWQHEIKRLYFRRQMRDGTFNPGEPEFDLLEKWLRPGDWVIDVGANVGHYTARFSALVGPAGRVLALEPIADTFRVLASNSASFPHQNVTLLNFAASEASALAGMVIPNDEFGNPNFYMAHLASGDDGSRVLCFPLDGLDIPGRVRLLKIDAEGHEAAVISGARQLIQRDRPLIIAEEGGAPIDALLAEYGYRAFKLPTSPNRIFSCDLEPPFEASN